MIEFFIPYSRDCDFWEDVGGCRGPSREFWRWSEIMLGEGLTISREPTLEHPWAITPHNGVIQDPDSEDGKRFDNGRLLTFLDPELAMLFKLRWI
jgi:hypothetical protein